MSNSFNLKKPTDLFQKLEREFESFDEASNPQSKKHRTQSDIAFNFCITAWHLAEWLWNDASGAGSKGGSFYGASSVPAFHKLIKSQCAALEICQELANGSKHFVLKKANPVVADTQAKKKSDGGPLRSPLRSPVRSPIKSPIPKYAEELVIGTSDGRKLPAKDVFVEVINYWKKYF